MVWYGMVGGSASCKEGESEKGKASREKEEKFHESIFYKVVAAGLAGQNRQKFE